jgi:hypothetical protein
MVCAVALVLALTASVVAIAPGTARSATGPTLSVTARGIDGTESVSVKRNGSTLGELIFGTALSVQSIVLPEGATWTELELQFNDAPGKDLIVTGFALDADTRSMVAGDVVVSGQWTGTECSSLGPPIGETIHCFGLIQFPADDGEPPEPPPSSELDPSYFGNSQTVVPVYDTAWDMAVQVTLPRARSTWTSSSALASLGSPRRTLVPSTGRLHGPTSCRSTQTPMDSVTRLRRGTTQPATSSWVWTTPITSRISSTPLMHGAFA